MNSPRSLANYFNLLPDELILEILLKADDLKTLFKWCQTSKQINQICQDGFFWHRKYQQDFKCNICEGWGLRGNIILTEGDSWKELYKLMILSGINSPISAGGISYGVIDRKGNLYMTGMGNMLGIGPRPQMGHYSQGHHLVIFSSKVVSISVGRLTVGAVTEDGRAYLWGYDEIDIFCSNNKSRIMYSPEEIKLPKNKKAIKIEVSQLGYIILLEDSSVYLRIYRNNKIDFQGLLNIKAIDVSIGWRIYTIITKDHKLYTGGDIFINKSNDNNELIPLEFPEPIRNTIATDRPIMVLSTIGNVYILDDMVGILNAIHGGTSPELVKLPEQIVQISAGGGTFAALSKTGKLYMWGNNSHNKISSDKQNLAILGQGEYSYNPNEISFGAPINFVSVGNDFSIAVTNDGVVNYWGNPERKPR